MTRRGRCHGLLTVTPIFKASGPTTPRRPLSDRTSLVVDPADGRIPEMTAEGKERVEGLTAHRRDHPADSYTDRALGERCISFGVPRLSAGYNSYYQVFQSRDHVVMYMEMSHDARVIPLTGRPHIDDDVRQFHGDSRGHWDGDTLVIETTNYSRKSDFKGARENLHVVERLTRVGPRAMNYEVTLNDPTTWTKPWTVEIPLKGTEDPVFEYACHEGNIGMEGILSGHRAEERAGKSRGL